MVFKPGLSVEEAKVEVEDADAVIVRSATKLKGELLDSAKSLKVIGRAGIGSITLILTGLLRRELSFSIPQMLMLLPLLNWLSAISFL